MKLLPLALAVASACHVAAHAQEAPAPAPKPDETAEPIEVVTVSARRREERLQDVPLTVTAFSGKALERQNVQNIGDLQGRVPNLTVYASRGTNTTLTAFIRGVGQADPLWGVDPGVGIYMDDVYMARPQGALLDVFDVQRIEVLRGPQGTLYGKNTIGGAIKYVSRPLSKDFGASLEGTAGNYHQRNLKASLNSASENGVLRARVAVARLRRDGFGSNTFNHEPVSDQDTDAARLSAGFYPDGLPFNVVAAFDGANDNSHVRGYQRMITNPFDPLKRPPGDSAYDIQSSMPTTNFTRNRGGSITATWFPTQDWTIKAIGARRHSTSAQTIDFDGLPLPIADVYGDSHDRQTSWELQAAYSGNDWGSGVLGVYRFEGTAGGRIFNNFLGKQFTASDSTVDTDSSAVYADWNWALGPLWNLNAGLRHTREDKHAVVLNQVYADAAFSKPLMKVADFDKTLPVSNTSPKLSLRYQASATTSLFANASRGFKSGGFNVRANNLAVPDSARPYRDEKLDAFELGAKFAAADGSFDLNAAVFHNRYRDIQLSVFTTYTQANGTPGFYGDFTNAGKGKVDGAELEFSWRPSRNWDVSGFASWLDAKYSEYLSGGKNVAGEQKFSNTPRSQYGLTVTRIDYDIANGSLRSMVGYNRRSKVYPTTDLSEAIAQPGYGLWNAGIVWEARRNWSFGIHGSNLANKRYRTDGYNIPALSILNGFYGPPRQVSARLGYRF